MASPVPITTSVVWDNGEHVVYRELVELLDVEFIEQLDVEFSQLKWE